MQHSETPFSEHGLLTHRLANGLQVVGQPMPKAESVALAYYMQTGARLVSTYEPAMPSRRIIVNQQRQQQIVMPAMPLVARESPDYAAAQVGASVLGRSQGSRLYWQIVHRGLAVSASASVWALEGTGFLLLQANSTPANARQVVHLLQVELGSSPGRGSDRRR